MVRSVTSAILIGLILALSACGGGHQSNSSSTLVTPLNDTGASYCVGSDMTLTDCALAPKQDGNTGRDTLAAQGTLKKTGRGSNGQDMTKLDAHGLELKDQSVAWSDSGSESASSQWSCVRDNHTGLIWEVKSSSPNSLRYFEYAYQWFQSDAATNGGYSGAPGTDFCGAVLCNTSAFVAAVKQTQLCGFSDWRLPTVNELLSLVVTDNLNLAIDSEIFPHTQPSHYWSRQSYAPQNTHAWYIYMSDGSPSNTLKSKAMYVRLVHESKGVQ